MKINLGKIYWAIKFGTIFVFGAILLFLIAMKMVVGPSITYNHDFCGQSNFIEGLFPEGRIELIEEADKCYEKILHEPVYFNVYSPRKFAQAVVILRYKKPLDLPVTFGLKLKTGGWAFDMKKLNETGKEFKEQEMEFDLRDAEIINNKLKFIIAGPAIENSADKVIIASTRFMLIK